MFTIKLLVMETGAMYERKFADCNEYMEFMKVYASEENLKNPKEIMIDYRMGA